ncbi:MAG: hypothetical protein LBI19_09100 [Oscillospiraceae bacterium]|jgi:hypothetical protein|nr:hypothetical protein [Oscillospiraceae bacterium]
MMNRREQLEQALERIHMPEDLCGRTLEAMRQQKRRRVSFEGFGRWAAIAASVAVLAAGGVMMWQYVYGGWKPEPPPIAVTPPVVTASPTPEPPVFMIDYRPEIVFYPSAEGERYISSLETVTFSDITHQYGSLTLTGTRLFVDEDNNYYIQPGKDNAAWVRLPGWPAGRSSLVATNDGMLLQYIASGEKYEEIIVFFRLDTMTGVYIISDNPIFALGFEQIRENPDAWSFFLNARDGSGKTETARIEVTDDGVWSVTWTDNQPSDEPLLLDLSFFIDIDWPEYPEEYTPSFTVFPLVNARDWKNHLSGPVVFVNESLKRVALPFEPLGYQLISTHTDGYKAMAYALKKDTPVFYDLYVLMLADGTIPLNADGEYYLLYSLSEYNLFSYLGSSVVVCRAETDDNGEQTLLFGLYDMEEKRELLPCEYTSLSPYRGAYGATTPSGMGYIIDAKGNVLYSAGIVEQPGIDNWVNFDLKEQYLYHMPYWPYHGYLGFRKWKGFYIGIGESITASESSFPFSYTHLDIADADGRVFHQTQSGAYTVGNEYSAEYSDEYMTILTHSGFEVIDKDGQVKLFPYNPKKIQNVDFHSDGEFVYFLKNNTGEWQALDQDGNVRDTGTYRKDFVELVVYSHSTSRFGLRDGQQNMIWWTDDCIGIVGELVLASYMDFDSHGAQPLAPRRVYDLDGNLLIDDVYGFIDDMAGPGGGVFVYLDHDTCVLLYPDGRTVPVPAAPRVQQHTWGMDG